MDESTSLPLQDPDLNLSLDSLEESDSESLTQEIKYQSQLQDWIFDNEGLVYDVQEKCMNDGNPNPGKSNRGIVISDGNDNKTTSPQNHENQASGYKVISLPKEYSNYAHLRYDPNWKKYQNFAHGSATYIEEDVLSDDSFDYTDYNSTNEGKNNNIMVRLITSDRIIYDKCKMESSAKLPNKYKNICVEKNVSCNKNDASGESSISFRKDSVINQPKDFIEDNKISLGVRANQKQQSYLHMHRKKNDNVPDKSKKNEDSQSPKETEPENQDVDLQNPSRKQKEALEPKFTHTQAEMARCFSCKETSQAKLNFPTSISAPMSNIKPSELKCNTAQPFAIKHFSDKLYRQEQKPNYDKSCYYSGDLLNANIAPDDRYAPQWQHSYAVPDKHRKLLQNPNRNTTCAAEIEKFEWGEVSNNERILNQDCIHLGHELFTVNTFRNDPFGTILQNQNGTFNMYMENNAIKQTTPAPDNCQAIEKKTSLKEKVLKRYATQEVKLGGIGPTYIVSEEKKNQLQAQKEYAKAVREQNKNRVTAVLKDSEMQTLQEVDSKGSRKKGLEYAKKIPKPQLLPKSTDQQEEKNSRNPPACDNLFAQIKLLEELRIRHEKEKAAVAALGAFRIL
ncbi:hypothetical protein GDO86_012845 [Hymenochirus boettgeri]|uniref:Uncharacterized protein n=1 Tax=Hymenochirus boettgeri TaxID=247094 RepID=A0A8T2IUB0_9PIPI|nr:hypothetical protein GDO86_012845 [Hymenochirus boettgeri]